MLIKFDSILISGFIISLSPIFLFLLSRLDGDKIKYLIYYVLAFSMGALTFETCNRLIPFVLSYHTHRVMFVIMIGIALFIFGMLNLLIRHTKKNKHSVEEIVIISVHNVVDGVALATSYLHSMKLGIITTLVLITHRLTLELNEISFKKRIVIRLSTCSMLIAESVLLISAAITYFCHHYEVLGSPFIMATASVFFLHILYKVLKKFFTLPLNGQEMIGYALMALIGYYVSICL